MLTRDLSLTLFDIGAIKTGNFTLKSGLNSPIYIDLRLLISVPDILEMLAQKIGFRTAQLDFDLVCGVPYTAIPIATAFSLSKKVPMILKRKEAKSHGTKKMVEGIYEPGQKVLLIEDIVTSGMSLLETIESLEEAGLVVEDTICLVDREQGGKEQLKKRGYQLHSLYNLTEILTYLIEGGRIDEEKALEIKNFIKRNHFQE
jgi:uridine monophosphate synthetase